MKTTIKKINVFVQLANHFINTTEAETKFKYALKKVAKQCLPVLEDYNSELEDIAVKHASVDEKGNLLSVTNTVTGKPEGYMYTKDAAILRKNEAKTLFNEEKEYPVTPFICTELPDLSEEQKEVLDGFVLVNTLYAEVEQAA